MLLHCLIHRQMGRAAHHPSFSFLFSFVRVIIHFVSIFVKVLLH